MLFLMGSFNLSTSIADSKFLWSRIRDNNINNSRRSTIKGKPLKGRPNVMMRLLLNFSTNPLWKAKKVVNTHNYTKEKGGSLGYEGASSREAELIKIFINAKVSFTKLEKPIPCVFIHSGLNASWYNLLANHTAILAADDTCLPDPTPDEVIVINVDPIVVGKCANDVEGSADNVDDVDDQDNAHYHSADNVNDFVRSFDLVRSFKPTRKRVDLSIIFLPHVLLTDPDRIGSFVGHKTLIFLGMLVLLKVAGPASKLDTLKENYQKIYEPSTRSIGLDKPKHDSSAEESVTHECKDVIIENE
nr:hypothetical protein [Tanacetum cinerariifolium]